MPPAAPFACKRVVRYPLSKRVRLRRCHMGYGICRVQKVKRSAVGSMQYHNDRMPGEHSNPNIDPDRREDNAEFIEHGSYRAEVNDRIERFRKSDRKVRKDAVVLVEGVMTASPEFFEGKTTAEVMAFFRDGFEFVKSEAGEENMIHFTVHMDESTPHAHFGFTPIKDGTLSWKKFFDGRAALKGWQDRFFEKVSEPWGLERGEQDTGRTHKDAAQMRRDAEREISRLREEVEVQRGAVELASEDLKRTTGEVVQAEQRLEGLQQREVQLGAEIADLQPAAVTFPESIRTLVSSRGDGDRERELEAEKAELGAGIVELEQQVAAARGRVGELERGLPALRARYERARERFELVEQRVTAAIQRLREVPEIVSDWALDIAHKLGKRTYDPNSLEYMKRQATEVARGMSSSREWHPQQRRDWGAR